MFDPYELRKDFPYLERKIRGKPIIYLDNVATTHKPRYVMDAIREFYVKYNANIHRGAHLLGNEAINAYKHSREKVARFINTRDAKEIIFTSDTTESLNLVAYG